MDEPSERNPAQLRTLLVMALASIVIGGSLDLLMDQPETWRSFHVIFEASMIVAALLMAATLWLGWYRAQRAMAELRAALEERSEERDAWRENARLALDGLARAIDGKFGEWSLTPAERGVALLLLKGFSHKHIAQSTGRSERTVRQHSVAVYAKSGFSGRSELSAFFLEDLLLPAPERLAVSTTNEGVGGRGGAGPH